MLSIFRILLIPIIVNCILHESKLYFWIGIGLVFIAIATDYLDGIFARKLNQISEYGKIFDPLADKIAIGTLVILLVMYRDLPSWVAIVIVGRDFLILLFGLFMTRRLKYVTSSSRLGKWTAFIIALMIVAYILRLNVIASTLTWISIFFALLSGSLYLARFIRMFKEP
jgi:CDP-diacylglycerol--glycerol-3-phosphate 3-phosphatidyltransferase